MLGAVDTGLWEIMSVQRDEEEVERTDQVTVGGGRAWASDGESGGLLSLTYGFEKKLLIQFS